MESSAISGSMFSKSLDIHQNSIAKIINSVPKMPEQDYGMRAASQASRGIGTNLNIVA